MTTREKLKQYGLDYKNLGQYFGYKPGSFENSTRRKLIEEGILRVIEHVGNKCYCTPDETWGETEAMCCNRCGGMLNRQLPTTCRGYGE